MYQKSHPCAPHQGLPQAFEDVKLVNSSKAILQIPSTVVEVCPITIIAAASGPKRRTDLHSINKYSIKTTSIIVLMLKVKIAIR